MPWKWGSSGQAGLEEKGESRSGVLHRTFLSTYSGYIIYISILIYTSPYTCHKTILYIFLQKVQREPHTKVPQSLLFIQRTMYIRMSFTIFPHTGLKIILILQIGYWGRVTGRQISVLQTKPFLSAVTCTLQLPQRTEPHLPSSPSWNHWAQIYFIQLKNGSQQHQSWFFPQLWELGTTLHKAGHTNSGCGLGKLSK